MPIQYCARGLTTTYNGIVLSHEERSIGHRAAGCSYYATENSILPRRRFNARIHKASDSIKFVALHLM